VSIKTFQELADEAFRDLLQKYGRPTDLKAALQESAKGPVSGRQHPFTVLYILQKIGKEEYRNAPGPELSEPDGTNGEIADLEVCGGIGRSRLANIMARPAPLRRGALFGVPATKAPTGRPGLIVEARMRRTPTPVVGGSGRLLCTAADSAASGFSKSGYGLGPNLDPMSSPRVLTQDTLRQSADHCGRARVRLLGALRVAAQQHRRIMSTACGDDVHRIK
jgi:hypothetical protein